ncbi:uncharacterized protein LOC142699467 [Rhinoderma darwinii]|uniref:uncharacterized protein LOC142699467 n=1 Tax=Rhinoderma darwinii TaxID=43563 RepID=UPI003F67169A
MQLERNGSSEQEPKRQLHFNCVQPLGGDKPSKEELLSLEPPELSAATMTNRNGTRQLSVAVFIGFLLAWTPYAMLAAFGDARDVPPIAFALAAMFAKSSTLYNPMVYLLLKPNFLHVISKDLSMFQAVCAVLCSSCRMQCLQDKDSDQTKRSSPFMGKPGTCCGGVDAFEYFSYIVTYNYLQCCNLDPTDADQPVHLSLVKNLAGDVESPTSMHLVVCASRTKSKTEATSGSLLPDSWKTSSDL